MHRKSIHQLHQALIKKEFSAIELTQFYLERIHKWNEKLNCFITICEEHALQQAKLADEKIAKNLATPLTGIPIAHKDIFCTKNIKTSCGSKMLDNFIAPYDATLIENSNKAGSITLGKTNMDEFAMGSSNENSFYGPVKNPWDFNAVPGGSSGGSSAAVAARLAPAASATDTGGSIRQPAALTGITGLKPTYGRVSRYGMVAFASSCDQAGPMAPSAEDIAYIMNYWAGHDEKDSTSVEHAVPDYTHCLTNSIKGLRIGLPKEYFDKSLNPAMGEKLDDVIVILKKLGAEFVDISLPHSHLSMSSYYIIAPAEASSNLARFDGVRYGYRCENPKDLQDLYTRTRGEGFGDEVKRRIMIGTYALSAGYYDAFYLKAQQIRQLIAEDFKKAFTEVDLIFAPTTASEAFDLGSKSNDPVAMYLSDNYTIAVNLAGLPAISLPMGFINQRPVGMQLIGQHFCESLLLNTAHQYQLQSDWHQQIPPQFI